MGGVYPKPPPSLLAAFARAPLKSLSPVLCDRLLVPDLGLQRRHAVLAPDGVVDKAPVVARKVALAIDRAEDLGPVDGQEEEIQRRRAQPRAPGMPLEA